MKKISILIVSIGVIILISAFTKDFKTIKLGIDWNGVSKENGFVTIDKKDKNMLKNRIEVQNFELNFYENSKKLGTFSIPVENFEKDSDWTAESPFVIDSLNSKKSFVLLHNGFPACGYSQNYFLFVKNSDNKIQKLDQWETYFDAPYGNYQYFKPINNYSFSRVLISINGSDKEVINEEEELAIVTKSDSVVFYQEKNRWIKKQITSKDKVYWQREMKLDDALRTQF